MIKLNTILNEMATASSVRKIKPDDRISMKAQKDFQPHSYTQRNDPTFKPNGLWYAKGKEWLKWVRKHMPNWEQEYMYRLDLDYSKILVLNKTMSQKEFEEKYGIWYDKWECYRDIKWKEVAKKYYGIEVLAPWGPIGSWIQPWDVSGGCIWNPGAIKNIKEL